LIHKIYFSEVSLNPYDYKDLQKYLCQINKIIPSEIWPSRKTLAPWDVNIDPPTPYQEQLKNEISVRYTRSKRSGHKIIQCIAAKQHKTHQPRKMYMKIYLTNHLMT
ncbi:hypothetical protein Goshw_020901, partial [Gossypium schwendimanii]|nr:hypothetical protein [Gossypium schwendimanii]